MEQFHALLDRHGETGVQALVETWERYNGVRHTQPVPLERRWAHFMRCSSPQMPRRAA